MASTQHVASAASLRVLLRRLLVAVGVAVAVMFAATPAVAAGPAAEGACDRAHQLIEAGLLDQAEQAYEALRQAPEASACAQPGLDLIITQRAEAKKALDAGKKNETDGDSRAAAAQYAHALQFDQTLDQARDRLAALTGTEHQKPWHTRASAWLTDKVIDPALTVLKFAAYALAAVAVVLVLLLWIPTLKRWVRKRPWRAEEKGRDRPRLPWRFAGWFVATPLHVVDFKTHDTKTLSADDLQALLVAELPEVASPRRSGVDVVMAPLKGATTASEVLDALQKVSQLTHVAAVLSFLRLVLPRDELQLTGYLEQADQGLGLGLTLGNTRGNAVASTMIWESQYAPPTDGQPTALSPGADKQQAGSDAKDTKDGEDDNAAADGEKNAKTATTAAQPRRLAVAGAVWTVYETLKLRGLSYPELDEVMGTRDWKSFALARLGAEARLGPPEASRWVSAQARDRDPNNLIAHLNLASVELRRPPDEQNAASGPKEAVWHLRYLQERWIPPAGKRDSRDPFQYQWAYTWYVLRLRNPDVFDREPDRLCDIRSYASRLKGLIEQASELEHAGSARAAEKREVLSELELPSLVLLASMIAVAAEELGGVPPSRNVPFPKRNEAPRREDVLAALGALATVAQVDSANAKHAETLVKYVQSFPLRSRTLYNLACYHGGSRDDRPEVKEADKRALRLLKESVEGATWLRDWAPRDKALEALRRRCPDEFDTALGKAPAEGMEQPSCLERLTEKLRSWK